MLFEAITRQLLEALDESDQVRVIGATLHEKMHQVRHHGKGKYVEIRPLRGVTNRQHDINGELVHKQSLAESCDGHYVVGVSANVLESFKAAPTAQAQIASAMRQSLITRTVRS